MVRSRSRSQERQHIRGKSCDRKRNSRSRRVSHHASHSSKKHDVERTASRRISRGRERQCDLRRGSREQVRRSSCHRGRGHSRSVTRSQSRNRFCQWRSRSRSCLRTVRQWSQPCHAHTERSTTPKVSNPNCCTSPRPCRSSESVVPCSEASTLANALMQAIKTMQPARTHSQHYFV